MKRFSLLFPLLAALILAWALAPLVSGDETLYLRDVFNTHMPMKWVGAEALARGELPLVDPFRGGGQPLLGNPNTVSLYPDNLLFLVAPFFWAFNAHFWLHLLVAPWAGFWLGRAWGLGRSESWVVGVAYAGSGFFLSTLNLYNLVAAAALAPALVAASLDVVARRRPRLSLAALGLLWAGLLLSGDPLVAALSLALAGSAVVFRGGLGSAGGRRQGLVGLAALLLGTGVAMPQLVEFARILPFSFRGYWGFSAEVATAASWDPSSAPEIFLPFAFGTPDLTFWGHAVYGGQPPLFYSLFPGVLALALVVAAGRPRGRAAWWSWSLVGLGLLFSMGRHNPLLGPLLELPGASLLRFPVKLWLLVAVGGSLLCGLGAARARQAAGKPLLLAVGALAVPYLATWAWLSFAPGATPMLRAIVPDRLGGEFVEGVRLRWAGLCLIGLLLLAVAAAVAWRWRGASRRSVAIPAASAGLALLAALHLASQLFLLRPLMATDELAPYLEPPRALESIPREGRVAHAGRFDLFGPVTLELDRYRDSRLLWLQRQSHEEVQPPAGVRWGVRYDMNLTPEGLDSFFTRAAAQAIRDLPDPSRLRVLSAAGIGHLLMERPLDPWSGSLAVETAHYPEAGAGLWIYRLPLAPPEVSLVSRVRRVPHLNAALAAVLHPSFDPRREVVIPARLGTEGDGRLAQGPMAPPVVPVDAVEVLRSDAERLELAVEAPDGGAVVIQRAWLPLWRARVDGEPAPVQVANLDRMAVEVSPGSHRVELAVDRRPLTVTLPLALLCLVALPLVAFRLGGSGC